jgi:hypothetical protein
MFHISALNLCLHYFAPAQFIEHLKEEGDEEVEEQDPFAGEADCPKLIHPKLE